jgi:hypothetical protein
MNRAPMAVNENQSEDEYEAAQSEYEDVRMFAPAEGVMAAQSEYEEVRRFAPAAEAAGAGNWPVGVRAVAVADNGKLKLSLRVSI